MKPSNLLVSSMNDSFFQNSHLDSRKMPTPEYFKDCHPKNGFYTRLKHTNNQFVSAIRVYYNVISKAKKRQKIKIIYKPNHKPNHKHNVHVIPCVTRVYYNVCNKYEKRQFFMKVFYIILENVFHPRF